MIEHPAGPLQKIIRKPDHDTATPVARALGEIDSKQLFADAKALVIRHDGERYTLRRTSKGKLILTK